MLSEKIRNDIDDLNYGKRTSPLKIVQEFAKIYTKYLPEIEKQESLIKELIKNNTDYECQINEQNVEMQQLKQNKISPESIAFIKYIKRSIERHESYKPAIKNDAIIWLDKLLKELGAE